MDDFAFRKGRHCGTVLIDMSARRPLHLYDGREGGNLAAWLCDRPEVKAACRDRSSGYGEGARSGAPQAGQVADRYQAGLGQAVEKDGGRSSFPPGRTAFRTCQHARRTGVWARSGPAAELRP
ncbi:transposase [Streptomyces sp. NRRL F-2664]|uniref:transposase n=1 Tax=Streptomyces sp. NRRL F-2664 TaxID=1463842 RepID=UPI00131E2B1B|nr:transposase [Streptomyces sp. NRRL F-2664]